MKVLFLTNIPSPYRVDFFNELGKYCDLTVLFEKQTSSERDSSWNNYKFENLNGIFLRGISISTDSALCVGLGKYIKSGNYDVIICSNFSSPTGIFSVLMMKLKKIPYFLEADGGAPKNGNGFKEWLKKRIIPGANGYFSTSKPCDNYFTFYGADAENLYRYPFTSLFNADILKQPLSTFKKASLRSELGIKEQKIIVSVGRFSYLNGYGKGYDTLLKVCENLPENVGVYIIGDEPTDEFKEFKKSKKLNHLHFLPFKLKNELFKYYRAANLSVLLSKGEAWGLVINESMANGTPVIATDACVGATEIIEHGVNGYIVPVSSPEAVEKCISDYFSSNERQEEMSAAALETIKNYTIENMAKAHIDAFQNLRM